jgi:hypothetical protein
VSDPERNPERRSDAALLCLCIGFGLMGLSWFLGFSGALGMMASGAWSPAAAGGLAAFILVPLTAVAGALFAAVGFIWIVAHVLIDRGREAGGDRYSKDVER